MTGAALEELDLSTVLTAFREQEAHGHTAATDAERKIECFGNELVRRALELRDVIRPDGRQNLAIALLRSARLAAYALATMRRIRIEQQRKENQHG